MLTLNWIKDSKHVEYCKESDLIPRLSKELGIPDLQAQIDGFRAKPAAEGLILRGARRSSVKLFIPNLFFGEEIDMGENIWLYLGDLQPAYCVYIPWEE